jgi:hypothetical protein
MYSPFEIKKNVMPPNDILINKKSEKIESKFVGFRLTGSFADLAETSGSVRQKDPLEQKTP